MCIKWFIYIFYFITKVVRGVFNMLIDAQGHRSYPRCCLINIVSCRYTKEPVCYSSHHETLAQSMKDLVGVMGKWWKTYRWWIEVQFRNWILLSFDDFFSIEICSLWLKIIIWNNNDPIQRPYMQRYWGDEFSFAMRTVQQVSYLSLRANVPWHFFYWFTI